MKKDVSINVEEASREIFSAYERFGLGRAGQGPAGIEWTFSGGAPETKPFSVARLDDRIVGISANIPARIKLGDEEGQAFQAVDSFVSEEVRGQRIFSRLASEFADTAKAQCADVLWGFPNRNAAPAWFGKLGWRNFGQVPFLIRPLNASFLLKKFGLSTSFPLISQRSVESREVKEFSSEFDQVWEEFSRSIDCAIVRDAEALNRRLMESPDRSSYRIRALGEGKDTALVVSRIENRHGARIAYILEAMGGAALKPLLRSELGVMSALGAELALAWCFPWSPNYAAYRSSGFLKLPERFRPVEINFGARALTNAGEAALLKDNWYLSYLDSDGI